MRTLLREVGRFRRDKSGNIAVIFTLALMPILSAVGCAVDYSRATQLRAKLQAAVDAASVGSAPVCRGDERAVPEGRRRSAHQQLAQTML